MADDYREVFWKGVTQIDVDIYEECLFIPIPSDPEYPEFEFRVSSKNGNTGEVVSRLSIRVRADAEIWNYIQKHPLWHKDPRPLLLVTIYDLLWRIKLAPTHVGEPFKRSFALGAIQGGMIYAEIVAEVFVDFGGVHVIHLANYANTHVLDQLEAVYKQNPEARPSGKYSEISPGQISQGSC